jgi:hypothetical protein
MTARRQPSRPCTTRRAARTSSWRCSGTSCENRSRRFKTASTSCARVAGPTPRAERSREVIERQVGHLARIVDDLLDVSRIVRGKLTLDRRPLDLAQLVVSTVDDFRQGFASRGIALQAHVPGSPTWILGDATRLAQLVGNLQQPPDLTPAGRRAVDVELTSAPRRLEHAGGPSRRGGDDRRDLARLLSRSSRRRRGATARGRPGAGAGHRQGHRRDARRRGARRLLRAGRGSEFRVRLPL